MNIQVAQAGTLIPTETEPEFKDISSAVFYEPGYNITNELYFNQDLIDGIKPSELYFYFRERGASDGNTISYLNIYDYNYNITVTDSYSGQIISSYIDLNAEIPDPYFGADVGLAVIDLSGVSSNCVLVRISNTDANHDIFFKIYVSNSNLNYSYIQKNKFEYSKNAKTSTYSSSFLQVQVPVQGTYILLAPYAMFKEVYDSSLMDFSYPNQNVMYQRYNIEKDDDYIYSIDLYGNSTVSRSVDVFSVPNYSSVGVVVLGAELYHAIKKQSSFFRLNIYGNESKQNEYLFVQINPYQDQLTFEIT